MGNRGEVELLADSSSTRRYAPVPAKGKVGRQHPRFYYRTLTTAVIHPIPRVGSETQHCYVLTRDISCTGISFLHPKKLTAGQRIELFFQDGKEVTANIQHVRQLAERCFLIGCKFTIVPDFGGKKLLAALNDKLSDK